MKMLRSLEKVFKVVKPKAETVLIKANVQAYLQAFHVLKKKSAVLAQEVLINMAFLKNKKAASGAVWVIITMILGIGIMTTSFSFLFQSTAHASTFILDTQIQQKYETCRLERDKHDGEDPKKLENREYGTNDRRNLVPEGDGFPDSCDLCLGGDDNQVSNSYHIPDDCFFDPTDEKEGAIKNYKDMCKKKIGGCYVKKTFQCCIFEDLNKCPKQCI